MQYQRESMGDYVKQILLDRILDGTYKPGDRLIELQIAHELGTSQTPIREALCELEAMRLVESQTYRGTRVRTISAEELQASYQVRAVLEALAAQLAAPVFQQHPDPLQQSLTALKDAAESQCLEEFAKYDAAFHRLIVETSGNQILLRVWDLLAFEAWARINLILVQHKTVNLRAFMEEHQQIFDALTHGEGQTAGQLLQQHFETAIKSEIAQSSGEAGSVAKNL